MLYEIINPSDCVTFECEDHILARAVIFVIGNGNYGGRCNEDEEFDCPIFLFDKSGFPKYWSSICDISYDDYLEKNRLKIADVLETFLCMDFCRREEIELAGRYMQEEAFKEFKEKINEERRSSMNNICGGAFKLAKKYREWNPSKENTKK